MTRRALGFLVLVFTAFPLSAAGISITTTDGKTHTWQNWYETSSSICTVVDDKPTCIRKRRIRDIEYPPARERLKKLRHEGAKVAETQLEPREKRHPTDTGDLEERVRRAEERMAEMEKRLQTMEDVLLNIETMLLELYRQ